MKDQRIKLNKLNFRFFILNWHFSLRESCTLLKHRNPSSLFWLTFFSVCHWSAVLFNIMWNMLKFCPSSTKKLALNCLNLANLYIARLVIFVPACYLPFLKNRDKWCNCPELISQTIQESKHFHNFRKIQDGVIKLSVFFNAFPSNKAYPPEVLLLARWFLFFTQIFSNVNRRNKIPHGKTSL